MPKIYKKKKYKRRRDKLLKQEKYLKTYINNGFNKKEAYRAVSPNSNETSLKRNSLRFHKKVTTNDNLMKKFKLSDLTPEYILEDINDTKEKAKRDKKYSDNLKANELLGDFKGLWNKNIPTENVYTKEQLDIIKSLVDKIPKESSGN